MDYRVDQSPDLDSSVWDILLPALGRKAARILLPSRELWAHHEFASGRLQNPGTGYHIYALPDDSSSPVAVMHTTYYTMERDLRIDSLGVHSSLRRQGIGTEILELTCSNAQLIGAESVSLLVANGNPAAKRLYERMGFTVIRKQEGSYSEMRRIVS